MHGSYQGQLHSVVGLGIKDLIIAPIPRRTPVTFLFIGDTIVDFFHETLEIAEVDKGIVGRNG